MAEPAPLSLPRRVQAIFDADGVLHEVIRRGLVNYRALARWMIATHDLAGTEDAVLSAIRRLRRNPNFDPFRSARSLLSQCHLNVRSRVCQILVAKTDDVRRRIPQMVQFVDFSKGEMLYFTWGEAGLKVLIDESNLGAVQNLFGNAVKGALKRLSAVTVVEPEAGLNTPGVLALMSETLALRGINVIDAVYGFPDYTFFVKDADAMRAYEALESLVQVSSPRRKAAPGRPGPNAHTVAAAPAGS